MTDVSAALTAIDESPEGPDIAAFFDFDGTIIDGYSALALLQHRLLHLDLLPAEAGRMVWSGVQAGRGAGFAHFMEQAAHELEGTPVGDLDDLGRTLLKNTLGGSLFPEMWELIAAHRRAGHRVVIASSAFPFQIEPLAAELGVDHVLCTRLVSVDGVMTGELAGDVLWGSGKANAVAAYAKTEDLDLAACFGYANGDEDIEFLSSVGHPHAVNPASKLARHADAERWPTLHFGKRARPSLMNATRTVAAYSGLATAFGVGMGIGLLNRSRRDAVNLTFSLGSDLCLGLAGIDVRVVGEEHLWTHRPAVYIFNHQSLLDPIAIAKLLRSDLTGVGKKEVARQPLVGQFAKLANVALVDRADSGKAVAALQPVVDRLAEGTSILIAPEGTRSSTPALGRFKKGPFRIAMQAEVPIVPVVLRNAGELLWRGSMFMRPGVLDVAVLPPIDVSDWQVSELDERIAAVRDQYAATLADWPR